MTSPEVVTPPLPPVLPAFQRPTFGQLSLLSREKPEQLPAEGVVLRRGVLALD